MADPTTDPRSVPQLLSDLGREISTLVRQESQLVRAEVSEKVGQVKKGATEMAAGAALLLVALIFVLQAAVIALADLIGMGWSSLIVGVLAAIVGFLMLKAGSSAAKPENLKPERSAHSLREDARLAKEQVK